ncbi:MAG: D-tyrosyl-tRNA(Tyr) deacylase [Planctomycetales bacterium]|nr:D-tyrosyl-tRNA(Tyr) deacylase [Planctomycetales bacterium]NIM08623.1 D-tyrosyl-tRNA(Tyr) deacylase [Planctomycetales bacterium]NIN08091.1 D-tyrosyl-tRNA(Tyr) deacylase [Planctomycetales bacterium]NIN77225.1 D-tyrosyl-tRNA(Tyr) deacylase [Planctomycetales bacterium]NIO35353.1 D-tyrosyl-tRNA(Tyr) deacylase [Planctomycetales bacterium]
MRACIQRVREASVAVNDEVCGRIGVGLLVLLGVAREDSPAEAEWLAEKVAGLRIFADDAGRMNRSVQDCGGSVLVVSQFTLLGDCRKGRRPSFVNAAGAEQGEALYQHFGTALASLGIPVQTGVFRAEMQVALVNDGPVTIWIDTDQQ